MLATPLRRAILLSVVVAGVLAAFFWGLGVTRAPDRLIRRLPLPGTIGDLEFSPDGRLLTAAGYYKPVSRPPTGTMIAWDCRTWAIAKSIPDANSVLNRLGGFSADSSRLLILHYSRATLWDTRSWNLLRTIVANHRDYLYAWAALAPDGKTVAVLDGQDSQLRLLRAQGDQLKCSASGFHLSAIDRFASDSQQIAYRVEGFAGYESIYIVDPSTGTPPRNLGVSLIAVSGDGRSVAGTNGNTIRFWNPKTWGVLRSFSGPGQDDAWDLTMSRDGRLIAVKTSYETRVYDTSTGWELARLDSGNSRSPIDMSPDGSKLALAKENEVQIWEIGSRDRLMARALFRRLTGQR